MADGGLVVDGAGHACDQPSGVPLLKVDIGGISGVIAPLLGKQPPDSHVCSLGGEAPAFVKSEQPLYNGGPVWRLELVSPVWPREK